MSIRLTTASVALILAFLSQPLFAQKRPLGLDMASTAERYAEAVGQRFSFVCPASDGGPAYVFGTDIYTDNSPICKAAIHAGALSSGVAGVVTIAIGSSVPAFLGSARNGVTTSSYRTWPRSYSFVTGGAPGRITWDTVWSNVPAGLNTVIALECPPAGAATGMVWGTMIYAGGSAICAAAVHAGAFTAARGGSIEIRRSAHSGEFVGSARNGVTSQAWPSQSEAFIVGGAASSVTQVPAIASAGVAIGDSATIHKPIEAMQSPSVLPAMATAAAGSGPKTVVVPAFTRVGAGIAATDVLLKLPLNLTRLSPPVRGVMVWCEVIPAGRSPAGRGAAVVPVVDARYVGTVEVNVPARGGVTGFSIGTVMRYYCAVGAVDAAGAPFNAQDFEHATVTGEFTW